MRPARRHLDGRGYHRHLGGHPQPNTASDQAEPYHKVILLRTVDFLHGLADETRVDEKRRHAGEGVALRDEEGKK